MISAINNDTTILVARAGGIAEYDLYCALIIFSLRNRNTAVIM